VIRVLVVEDHPVVADGWRAGLDAEPDMTVAGLAATVAEARDAIAGLAPDVALIDVRLRDGSGLALLGGIDLARTAPIIVSASASPAYLDAAQRLGARGYLLKTSPMGLLLGGVRDVARGGTAWDGAVLMAARARPWHPLSERERDVVEALIGGRSNDEIGRALGITAKTVESHLTRLYTRVGAESRGALLRLALEEGWLDIPWAAERPPRLPRRPPVPDEAS
jgi:two-component system NarL family response regulator